MEQTTRINRIDRAEMIWIPPGPFLMGDDDQSDNPRRTVTLSGYFIYKNLVTVAQYKMYCKAKKAKIPDAPDCNPGWSKQDRPIANVSWPDAEAYCEWARVNLPTETQWEKAARGTDGRKYPWGEEFDVNKSWASRTGPGAAIGTVAEAQYGISPYGLTDMVGNVNQWCADWYEADYTKSAPAGDPMGPRSGTLRVVRGCRWSYGNSNHFRCARRDCFSPSYRGHHCGFRCSSK